MHVLCLNSQFHSIHTNKTNTKSGILYWTLKNIRLTEYSPCRCSLYILQLELFHLLYKVITQLTSLRPHTISNDTKCIVVWITKIDWLGCLCFCDDFSTKRNVLIQSPRLFHVLSIYKSSVLLALEYYKWIIDYTKQFTFVLNIPDHDFLFTFVSHATKEKI